MTTILIGTLGSVAKHYWNLLPECHWEDGICRDWRKDAVASVPTSAAPSARPSSADPYVAPSPPGQLARMRKPRHVGEDRQRRRVFRRERLPPQLVERRDGVGVPAPVPKRSGQTSSRPLSPSSPLLFQAPRSRHCHLPAGLVAAVSVRGVGGTVRWSVSSPAIVPTTPTPTIWR